MSRFRGSFGGSLARNLTRLHETGSSVGLGDSELLKRYALERDESAFESLVERHGPMIRRVCRRLLNDPSDVEDAVQATFLVLVRKAGRVRRPDLLGNWLYGVACRVSAQARSNTIRRRDGLESIMSASPPVMACRPATRRGGDPVIDEQWVLWLHEEIQRLPLDYQTPVILCYFEGLTHEATARRLSWPIGTVKGRLARARELLRKRLGRKGVALTAAMIEIGLGSAEAVATVSLPVTSLVSSTALSASVIHLAQGVSHAMILTQLKAAVLPVLLTGAVASGMVLRAGQGDGGTDAAKLAARTSAVASTASKDSKVNTADSKEKAAVAQMPSQGLMSNDGPKAVLEVFDLLVKAPKKFDRDDYQRLIGWSQQILDECLQRSRTDDDRRISLEAHRERLRMLAARIARTLENDGLVVKSPGIGDGLLATAAAEADAEKRLAAHYSQMAKQAQLPKATPERATKSKTALAKQTAKADSKQATETPYIVGNAGPYIVGNVEPLGVSSQGAQSDSRRGMMGMAMGTGPGGPNAAIQRQAMMAVRRRIAIAGEAAALAVHQTDEKSQQVFDRLEQLVDMSFANGVALDGLLKQVNATSTPGASKTIPIYVDPKGLKAAGATLSLPDVQMDLKGIPLKTTLRLALKQLGLAYCVRDGVLIISDVDGISAELEEAESELNDRAAEQHGRKLNKAGRADGPFGGTGPGGGVQ